MHLCLNELCEIELFWHLTVCKQKTKLILIRIVWNKTILRMKIHLALMNYNGWCAIKTNQTKPISISQYQSQAGQDITQGQFLSGV